MKGIILAGGSGSRLYPVTRGINKHLIPVYDKPMIYYPLAVLMLGGIREVLIISGGENLPLFQRLLRDGSQIGLAIQYAVQARPNGIPEAFIIGHSFIDGGCVALVLGDNIIFGEGLTQMLRKAACLREGGLVFGYPVRDPCRYGVLEFDETGRVIGIEEKPENPKSSYIIPGLYFYDNQVVELAESLHPSSRGELEITDVNSAYLERGQLEVIKLGRGIAWLDAGTHEALTQATSFVQAVQERQGLMVANIEEIAFRQGYIDEAQLRRLVSSMPKNGYAEYLRGLLE